MEQFETREQCAPPCAQNWSLKTVQTRNSDLPDIEQSERPPKIRTAYAGWQRIKASTRSQRPYWVHRSLFEINRYPNFINRIMFVVFIE